MGNHNIKLMECFHQTPLTIHEAEAHCLAVQTRCPK